MDEKEEWSVWGDREAYLKLKALKYAVMCQLNESTVHDTLEEAKKIVEWLKGE